MNRTHMHRGSRIAGAITSGLVAAIGGAGAARAANTVKALNFPDDVFGAFLGINNRGDIAGEVYATNSHAMWYRPAAGPEQFINLEGVGAHFAGLNERGEFAYTTWASPDPNTRLNLFTPGMGVTTVAASPLVPVNAFGLNNAGQSAAVGRMTVGGQDRAQRFDPGVGFVDLGGPSNSMGAYAINESGQVAGVIHRSLVHAEAAIHTPGAGWRSLGSLSGRWTWVQGMNDRGDVVGFSQTGPALTSVEAYVVMHGQPMRSLGVAPGFTTSIATAINNNGWVIGALDYARPFLWTEQTGILDLNSLLPENAGWQISQVYDINDSGQIIGIGYHNGTGHFLFEMTVNSVPAPPTAGVLAAACLLVATRRRR